MFKYVEMAIDFQTFSQSLVYLLRRSNQPLLLFESLITLFRKTSKKKTIECYDTFASEGTCDKSKNDLAENIKGESIKWLTIQIPRKGNDIVTSTEQTKKTATATLTAKVLSTISIDVTSTSFKNQNLQNKTEN